MSGERFEQLTQRQRECLRLYHRRYRIKEIARELSISENTASGYLTEAAALLNVGGRQAASAALASFEAAHPEARGRFSVGDSAGQSLPTHVSPAETAPANETVAVAPPMTWAVRLPFRQGDGNDLSIAQRFLWLAIIVVGIFTGFGLFAIFVRTVSDVFAGIRG